MGMQTMQAQQPMQGGGKGSMIQPPQYSQGAGSMDIPQQPMPQDMGRGYRQNNGEGGYGGELPSDYVGNTAQQQPMQGGGKAAGGMGQSMGQQPRFGQPNRYSNTTQQPWDNANINPQPSGKGAGGKGGGMQQGGQMQGGAGKGQAGGGFPTAATNFGQGAPLTQALSTANTANLGQVDDYSAPMSGGQGA